MIFSSNDSSFPLFFSHYVKSYLARWQFSMYDRSPLHWTIVSRIGRLTDFHLGFSITENLIMYTFSFSLDVKHVAVGFAFALCRRNWTIDIGIHVRRFFQVSSSVFCKMERYHIIYLQQNNIGT